MIIDIEFIKNNYNDDILSFLDSHLIYTEDTYDKKFNKEFYEKTYNLKFNSIESAYLHWKINRNKGYLGYPFVENEITYNGQILQDYIVLKELFKFTKLGTFIEFGACDGLFLSNTLVLEDKFKWNGLLIEGLDEYYKELIKNRKCEKYQAILYSEDDKEVEFATKDNLEVSGVVDHLYVNNGSKIVNKKLIKTKKLETILDEIQFKKVIHFMSIDVEGAEYEILKVFPFDKYKIYSLTVEHGGNQKFKSDIDKLMETNNYIIYKELAWDTIYILPELLTKVPINSFDFFDTLVHRYYYDENSILEIIQRKYALENFVKVRKQVEFITPGTLNDIYNKIYEIHPEWIIYDLEKVEFELEKSYLIPNSNMINEINKLERSLLISDTFYSKEQMEELCTFFGINSEIHISRSGKKEGWIYDKLSENYIIVGHYGDNLISDIKNANEKNINSYLVNDRYFKDVEKKLYSSNLKNLALLLRTCRLMSSTEYNSEISLIFIVNLILSEIVNRKMNEYNLNNVLMTQRDCCHISNIFNLFYPNRNTIKLYTSRQALKNSNHTFVNYYKRCVKDDCLILDMNGTGYSTFEFCKKNNINLSNNTKMLFAILFNNRNSKLIDDKFKDKLKSILNNSDLIDQLEIINLDVNGKTINYDGIPIRENVKYDISIINNIHLSINKVLEFIKSKNQIRSEVTNELNDCNYDLLINILIFILKYLKQLPLYKKLYDLFKED